MFVNKDEYVNWFSLSAIKGGTFEERKRKKEIERDCFEILYTGYLLSIVEIKREIEREKEERERERREREREREKGWLHKIIARNYYTKSSPSILLSRAKVGEL